MLLGLVQKTPHQPASLLLCTSDITILENSAYKDNKTTHICLPVGGDLGHLSCSVSYSTTEVGSLGHFTEESINAVRE